MARVPMKGPLYSGRNFHVEVHTVRHDGGVISSESPETVGNRIDKMIAESENPVTKIVLEIDQS